MSQATMTYVLSNIVQCIPSELLELAFRSQKYNTTIEQRIISEIIEGPILLDTNLVGGKRRDIILSPGWEMNMPLESNYFSPGIGVQGSYYKVPPEAREGRNISSVIGITNPSDLGVSGGVITSGGGGYQGNTASGLLSAMLGTHTNSNSPIPPQITLEGTNIIRFYPKQIVDGVAVSIILEYDSEFINMNASAIVSLMELCLIATKRYIANKLIVTVDETQIVAGMEIGVIRTLIDEYKEAGNGYYPALIKFKGSSTYDPRSLSKLIYYAL